MANAVDAQLTDEALNSDNIVLPDNTNVVMISLPPSLFDQEVDQVASNEDVGLAFTFYESSNLFPLANGIGRNAVIGSSVIGAIVAGKPVLNLPEPVIIVLPLLQTVSNVSMIIQPVDFVSLCFRISSILCVSVGIF